jgi:hypothetical protein
MNKNIKIAVVVVVVIIIAVYMIGFLVWFRSKIIDPPTFQDPTLPSRLIEPKMCTMEAKLCPDGSTVSRVAPNCEFAECPSQIQPSNSKRDCENLKKEIIDVVSQYNYCEADNQCSYVISHCQSLGSVLLINKKFDFGRDELIKKISTYGKCQDCGGGYMELPPVEYIKCVNNKCVIKY